MEFGSGAAHDLATASPSLGPTLLVFHGILMPLVGRVFLACLPPGLPGRHAPRELLATWVASVLLGLTWMILAGALLGSTSSGLWVFFGGPLVVLAGLVALRPAGLVPRHEPVPEPWSASGRVLAVAAFAVLAVHAVIRPSAIFDAWLAAASVGFVLHALELARVRSDVRGAAALLVAVIAVPFDRASAESDGLLGLVAASVAAGTIGWLRRGDRRALGLASAALALAPYIESTGFVLGLGLATTLVLGSARPARARAASWTFGGLAIGFTASFLRETPLLRASPSDPAHAWSDLAIAVILALTLVTAWVLHRRSGASSPNPSGAPVGREWKVLLAATAFALVVWIVGASIGDAGVGRFLAMQPRPHGAVFTLVAVAGAIALSRGLERRPSTR